MTDSMLAITATIVIFLIGIMIGWLKWSFNTKIELINTEIELTMATMEKNVKSWMDTMENNIKRDMKEMESRMTIKLGGIIAGVVGFFTVMDKFL